MFFLQLTQLPKNKGSVLSMFEKISAIELSTGFSKTMYLVLSSLVVFPHFVQSVLINTEFLVRSFKISQLVKTYLINSPTSCCSSLSKSESIAATRAYSGSADLICGYGPAFFIEYKKSQAKQVSKCSCVIFEVIFSDDSKALVPELQ